MRLSAHGVCLALYDLRRARTPPRRTTTAIQGCARAVITDAAHPMVRRAYVLVLNTSRAAIKHHILSHLLEGGSPACL